MQPADVAAPYASYRDLAGRCVVVTGGGSGIGAEIVTAFAGQGARVYLLDIADAEAHRLTQALGAAAHPPVYIRCNMADLEAVGRAFARIAQEAGVIDVLVNNCANDDRHAVDDVTPAYWDERMAVNLRHLYFCAQAAARTMRTAGRGAILNLGSISWHLAMPKLSLYMTAKAAIEGMTTGLARDLGVDGIRVNCIIPGGVRTPRQAALWHSPEEEARMLAGQCLPQRVEMQDVAAMALFLASDSAARCSGRNYFVDAGWYGYEA
ncbi:SDR family NAD(P)-dependent oxidoreductase [Massilia terrae]|uniref:SDR family oxidoreductase n=1 Tax=Massilia terrae TaxID=1811224 RepID=A0ABT2CVP8_9BURK|nr:SDR family oxidoreductase [Massilia terrae]MCS0657158.1 SDR family oxidoreductase [Massilia terrae]